MSTSWEELVSTALLGTERRTVPPMREVEADQLTLAERRIRSLEGPAPHELLSLAALFGTVRRAGERPVRRSAEERAEEQPDATPVVRQSASQILDLLLTGTVAVAKLNDTLILRWTESCARADQRVPTRLIVPLLERATKAPGLRASAAVVVGQRGRFVASRNREWNWVHAAVAVEAGSSDAGEISAERLAAADSLGRSSLVAAWRLRDPQAARDAVIATWASESAADRRDFTLALRNGLSASDEPFLERCLDDRGKTVREAAQSLLPLIPTSAFVTRMTSRLESVVKTKRFPRFSIDVELPEESLDEAANRDGLVLSATKARAELLRQIVAAVPVRWWAERCDRSLEEVIAALRRIDTAGEVITGFCESAARQAAFAVGTLNRDDRAGLHQLWLDESDHVDAGYRSGKYNYMPAQRVALLQPALVADRELLISMAFDRDWSPNALGETLARLVGDSLVPPPVADRLLVWAKRHSGDLEVLLVHPIELLVASMSSHAAAALLNLVPTGSTAHQRLRHLQAAGSFIDAISKEFP